MKSGATIVTTLFICHNCSDVNSQSGEACCIEAFEGIDSGMILHGANDCVMGYKRNISDDERKKYEPLILPPEISIDTDFYKLGSHEAEDNFLNILNKPLWICNFVTYYKSNEDQLWDQAKEQIYNYNREQRYKRQCELKAQADIKTAYNFFDIAKPCVVDPVNNISGLVR